MGLVAGTVTVGSHPAASILGGYHFIYVALRGQSSVVVIDTIPIPATKRVVKNIAVGSHPCDLALSPDGAKLYVAVCDDDAVAVIDTRTNTRIANIAVGMKTARVHGYGANPNALLLHGNDLFVSLGGENAIARIRNG